MSRKIFLCPVIHLFSIGFRKHFTKHIKSVDSGHRGAVTTKQPMQYTGNKIIGIGTMHKSNAVPIFTDDEAKAISSMRR